MQRRRLNLTPEEVGALNSLMKSWNCNQDEAIAKVENIIRAEFSTEIPSISDDWIIQKIRELNGLRVTH